MGVSQTPVIAALKRLGIERRSTSEYSWQPTAENRAEVVRLWHEGLSQPQIARKVGTGNDVISRVVREEGLHARFGGQNRRFKGADLTALIEEYGDGHGPSLTDLARKHECSTAVIRNALRREGVEIISRTRPDFWTPERIQWLREQYESGRSQVSIADEIGYTQHGLRLNMLKFGIVRPTPQAKGSEHGQWKGGRHLDASGYVKVRITSEADRLLAGERVAGRYFPEHRLVMGRILGRPLLASETVHHVNGDKQDNSPGNLQLRQGAHGKGVALQCNSCGSHDVVAVPLAS